jgi:hypothetical protein
MKSTFAYGIYRYFLWLRRRYPNCAARFHRNKMVAEIRSNAGAIVTQYTYDDIIEACVSSDENGNFFKTISLQTLEQLPLLQ